jgi:hypothetical protein
VLVVLDSLGSFYYRGKMAEACAGAAAGVQAQVLALLWRMVSRRSAVVVATKPCLFPPKNRDAVVEHREYMPQRWQGMVRFRLLLWKERGPEGEQGSSSFAGKVVARDAAGRCVLCESLCCAWVGGSVIGTFVVWWRAGTSSRGRRTCSASASHRRGSKRSWHEVSAGGC